METTPQPPATMAIYSQPYIVEPAGIDRYWQTPLEVYYYLLFNPVERNRVQHLINRYWHHRRHIPVRINHRCTMSIRLLPWTSDQAFVNQLNRLIRNERNLTPRRRCRRQQQTRGQLPCMGKFSHMHNQS